MYNTLDDDKTGTYAYSLGGYKWTGKFKTREEAKQAAFNANTDIGTIYTGLYGTFELNYEEAVESALNLLEDSVQDLDIDNENEAEWNPTLNNMLKERIAQAIKQGVEALEPLPSVFTSVKTYVHIEEHGRGD